ncbi:MAG: superoxide reductase [Deltaproteobacteria bacterium]|nr:MAG: superoxide reductase [Deltaproteobacteria bacterium]
MAKIGDAVQSADWKAEKHVPAIEIERQGDLVYITATVGKEIAHPNTTEHHIRWISLYYQAEGDKFIYHLGKFTFDAHGESTEGANQGPVYTEPVARTAAKISKPGKIYAVSYCNIHGLWESSVDV